jgi:hypothetical protein
MDFTTKRSLRTTQPVVSIPKAIITVSDYPTPAECKPAKSLVRTGRLTKLCSPFETMQDGVYVANLWAPEPLCDRRHLPYEHPFRDEWNTELFDVPELDIASEYLPMAWSPREFRRLFAWEFAIHRLRQEAHHRLDVTIAAFQGGYAPITVLFGCNAFTIEPDLKRYVSLVETLGAHPSAIPDTELRRLISKRRTLVKQRERAAAKGQPGCPLVVPQSIQERANSPITVSKAESEPLFYWRLPSYIEKQNLTSGRVDDYPDDDLSEESSQDLEAEQYCWDTPVYDDFSLDFSKSPTPDGWTRLQHLRYSTYCVNLANLRMASFRRR